MKGREKRYVYPHPHKRNLADTEPDSLRKLFPARGGPLAAPSHSVPWAAGCCPSGRFYVRLAATPRVVSTCGWLLPLGTFLRAAGCCPSGRFYVRLAAAPRVASAGGWLLPLRLLFWVAGCCSSDRAVSSDFLPGVDAVSRRNHTPRLTPLTFVASQQNAPAERLS